MNNYYYLHHEDYYRHVRRQAKVRSQYAKNIDEVIGTIEIGPGPPLLTKKYVWGRECKTIFFRSIFVKFKITEYRFIHVC